MTARRAVALSITGALALVVVLWLPSPRAAGGRDARDTKRSADDPSYNRAGTIDARHYRLVTRLAMKDVGSFARLSRPQRAQLEALVAGSRLELDAYALADRLLLVLPETHPAGPLDLVLCDDRDALFLFDARRKRGITLASDAFPDVLDGAELSQRSDFEATLERRPVPPEAAGPPHKMDSQRLALALRYRPPHGRGQHWSLRLKLVTTGAERPPRFPFQHPLHHLALPLLQTPRGLPVLETLAARAAVPERWSLAITNETLGGPTVTFETTVEDLRWQRLPLRRFAVVRPGITVARARWRDADSKQLLPKEKLTGLRSDKPAGPLEVRNQSPLAALVYVDGALAGWVAPGAKLSLEGLSAGFYRVFAVAPSGVRAWGPHDTYIPGPLTLR